MAWFRHPFLVRGVVQTDRGRFFVSRGLVEAPDDVGERYGWLAVDPTEPHPNGSLERQPPVDSTASRDL